VRARRGAPPVGVRVPWEDFNLADVWTDERGARWDGSAEIIGDRQNLGSNAEKQEKQNIGADRYYRTDGAAFKKMGAVKAATLQVCALQSLSL
jgi:hypothetical protein